LVERPVEVRGLAPEMVLDGVGVEVPPPGVGAWLQQGMLLFLFVACLFFSIFHVSVSLQLPSDKISCFTNDVSKNANYISLYLYEIIS